MTEPFDWHLENWMRWCRRRDWMPLGHVSQLGFMIRQAKQESVSATDAPIPVYEDAAMSFHGLVMNLPKRHMAIFLLNHLDKGILGQRIVYTRHAGTKFALAGLPKSTFYRRASEADGMIRRWME